MSFKVYTNKLDKQTNKYSEMSSSLAQLHNNCNQSKTDFEKNLKKYPTYNSIHKIYNQIVNRLQKEQTWMQDLARVLGNCSNHYKNADQDIYQSITPIKESYTDFKIQKTTKTKSTKSSNTKNTNSKDKTKTIQSYVDFAVNIANDNSHGYDQNDRMGAHGNYDCSGLVISAVEKAGIKVKEAGATYTGNIQQAFLKCGFKNVTNSVNTSTGSGLQKGDILLLEGHHVAIYVGNGKMVDARINEKGTTKGGKSGDQTCKEIMVHDYDKTRGWNCILRLA